MRDALAAAPRFRARYARGVGRLAWAGLLGRVTVSRAVEEAEALRKRLSLETLFGALKPRVSLHTPFGNGRCEWAKDSGVITAAARENGAVSVGYQTRCVGLKSHEEFFDSYDVWCAWGEAWAQTARSLGFMRETCVIGDVNLAERGGAAGERRQSSKNAAKTSSIFPFVVWVPAEWFIRDYCFSMVEAVLTAAGRLQRETGQRRTRVDQSQRSGGHRGL